MSCFFSTFKSLLTAEIKEKINAEINSIYDCYNWSDISQMISLDHFETYDWDYAKFLNRKNMFEDLAKLSLNLWNDYEYYKRFTFQSRYKYRDYISRLVDLGYKRQLSGWNSQMKPSLLEVQSNIFMFSMYTAKCNNMNSKGDFQPSNETKLITEIKRDKNVGEDKEIQHFQHLPSADSEIIYKDLTFLINVEIKEKINEKINIIKDCLNWNNISQRIFLHRVETSDLNKEEFLKKNKIWEFLAKLSLNLWKDYEYYKEFTFQAKYDDEDYVSQLVNLGYECKDGSWKSLKKPSLLDVQLNIFMYCMYMSMCNDTDVIEDIQQNNENELRQQSVFQDVSVCGNNVKENIDIQPLQYPPSADDQIILKDLTCETILLKAVNYVEQCQICLSDIGVEDIKCPVCLEYVGKMRRSSLANNKTQKNETIMTNEDKSLVCVETDCSYERSINSWTCPSCTYINTSSKEECGVCFSKRNNNKSFELNGEVKMKDEENSYIKKIQDNISDVKEGITNGMKNNMKKCYGFLFGEDDIKMKLENSCDSGNTINTSHLKVLNNNIPQQSEDIWICSSCTFKNKMDNNSCEICLSLKCLENEEFKINIENKDNLESESITTNTWNCIHCQSKNPFDRYICGECEELATFSKRWRCRNCRKINEIYNKQCVECSAKKDTAKCVIKERETKEDWVNIEDDKCVVCKEINIEECVDSRTNKEAADSKTTEGLEIKMKSNKRFLCKKCCENL